MIDLFAIPDYQSYFTPHIDKKFAKYSKEKWTQLQWRFQKVSQSKDFPLGVKTTYRAYASENVYNDPNDKDLKCGIGCVDATVK